MPDKVTLIRKDGSLMDATPEQAGRLALLGYRQITPEANDRRLRQEATEDYYTTGEQQAKAAAEGFFSGLSFGGSDYLAGLVGDQESLKGRAQYNPGTRMVSEALGALLPLALTGGESGLASGARAAEEAGALAKGAKYLPTSLLSQAAETLAPGKGLLPAVARGAVEGAAYGGAGAADHAYLNGDPITAETVLHGLKWGAVIGGGLGAFGHAVEVGGENARLSQEAEVKAGQPIAKGTLNKTAGAEYTALRDEVAAFSTKAKEVVNIADAQVKSVTDKLVAMGENANLSAFGNSEVQFIKEVRQAQSLYDQVTKAVSAGKFEKAQTATEAYATHVNNLAKRLGMELPDVTAPLKDLVTVRTVQQALSKMPRDVEAFANMGKGRAEQLFAALDHAKTAPITNDIAGATDRFVTSFGVDTSLPASGLRAAHQSAKGIYNSEGKVVEVPTSQKPGLARQALGYAVGGKAWLVSRAAGVGRMGSYAAYKLTRDAVTSGGHSLVGVKAAALNRIRGAAAAYGERTGVVTQHYAPAIAVDPLSQTLFGGEDKSTKERHELAMNRVKEIAQFSPTASDSIYKAVQPLAVTQPMLVPSIHKAALAAFQALQLMSPKDPGAIAGLQSLWKPSPVQAALLAKQLAVFHDPINEAAKMLESGQFDYTKLQALKEIAPSIWQEMRVALLERVTQPGVMAKLPPEAQVGLSVALGIPVHSRMQPGQIATGQQIFLDRNKPLTANPRMGQGGGLPNPSDKNATAAQKSTER